MKKWYYFPHRCLDGQLNMDIDHSCAKYFAEIGVPMLRFFGWNPHTLSIGYHQKESDFDLEKLANEGFGFVRRPTGGRAIFHATELTYSVVFPNGILPKTDVYKKIHHAFISGFEEFGLDLNFNRSETNFSKFYKTKESLSCFSASAKYEATVDKRKFVGSAQRVYTDAILQHGSIMLSDDYLRLIDFSILKNKEDAKDALRKKTFYYALNETNITMEQLCETLLKHFINEFNIKEVITEPFNLETWTHLEQC